MARRKPHGPRDLKLREMRDALPVAWRQLADIYLHVSRKLFDEQPVAIGMVWTRFEERASPGLASVGDSLGVRKTTYACVRLARYEVAEVGLLAPSLDGRWSLVATVQHPSDGALAVRLEHGFSRTILVKGVQGSCSVLVARPHSFGCDVDAMDPPEGESSGDSCGRRQGS